MAKTLKDILGDLFTDEIKEALGDAKVAVVNDGSYIPREKFNEKEAEVKELKRQLEERDSQLEVLKKAASGNEELSKQIEELKKANLDAKTQYEAQLKQQAKDFAVDKAISEAKGRNAKAIKALLDMEKVSLDGDNLLGFAEQLEAVKTSDPFLFGDDVQMPVGGGTNPAGGGNRPKSIDEQIEEALAGNNLALSIALKNKKYLGG
jgi:sulfur carrier protein ThiS